MDNRHAFVQNVPMHVLVVDDDEEIRALLRRVFTARGHSVEDLDSGFSVGLRLASTSETPIDAIILDFMMPGLSGVSVLQQLASSPVGRKTPVVLFSAIPEGDLPSDALSHHPKTVFLQKGTRVQELATKTEALVGVFGAELG